MALTDTGTPDDERSEASQRLFEQLSKSRGIDIPPQNVNDTYTPTLPESISPLSPAGQLTRVAQADTDTATDGSATFAERADAAPQPLPDWLQGITETPWDKKFEWTTEDDAKINDAQQKVKNKASVAANAPRDQQLMNLPQPQQPSELPMSPIGDFRNNLKSFATPLMILGAVASVGGRRRALNSMNALGGLFKGMAAGNAELARLQYQKFHGSVNGLIAETEYQNMQYKAALNSGKPTADILAELSSLAAGFQDPHMQQFTQEGNLQKIHEYVDGREKTNEHLMGLRSRASRGTKEDKAAAAEERSVAKAQKPDALYEDQAQAFARCGGDPTCEKGVLQGFDAKTRDRVIARGNVIRQGFSPEQRAQQQEAGGLTPNQSAIVEAIMSGKRPPTTQGLYKDRVPIEAGLERRGFDLKGAQLQWQAAQRQVASLNSERANRLRTLSESVLKTIDRVDDLSKKMDQGGISLLNEAQLAAYVKGAGTSPNGILATQYLTQINTLKELFANLVQGGYAPTEPAFALANQQINAGYGASQLHAALGEVRRDIQWRFDALVQLQPLVPGQQPATTGAGAGGAHTDPAGIR